MRKTKIVCTLGLVSNTPEVIERLMDAGMDVARFNFSHGTHESHKEVLDIVRSLREKKNIPVAALLDTKGPEIRLGLFENDEKVLLTAGDQFVLYTDVRVGTKDGATVSFAHLDKDVKKDDTILLDDGLIELTVTKVEAGKISCKIVNGGYVSNRKGVNIPGVDLSMPYMSEQDKKDIIFGCEQGYDFVAASFVRNAADVKELRDLMNAHGGQNIGIIAKIENGAGIKNLDEIMDVVEGVMVARGDMGVEVPFEELPHLQKMMIKKCYQAGKVVITATQMLESMINNPRPTRAEVSDVANAIYDGTSAIMLSGESAAGKYPVESVETMVRIALRTEEDIDYEKRFRNTPDTLNDHNVTNAISHATCTIAYDLEAAGIITVTISGRSARNVSKFRPDVPVFGCTTSDQTYHQLSLSWGVVPVRAELQSDLNVLVEHAVESVKNTGAIKQGDTVVLTTGVPMGMAGTTNLIKVHVCE